MVSDQMIHSAFRNHTTLYIQNTLMKFLIFTIYQNYTLALKSDKGSIQTINCWTWD